MAHDPAESSLCKSMNWPNRLTIFRLVLTVVFVVSFSVAIPYAATAALGIFVLASFTDWLDGWIARKWHLVTDFGKLMDPLADKILTASAFISLIPAVPAWAVILIIAREFLITGLRLLASSKGVVLSAEKLGKHKTAWQMLTIIYFLAIRAWADWQGQHQPAFAPLGEMIGFLLVAMTVLLTVISGWGYFWRHRSLLHG